jgi:hypothetical protein
LNVYFCLIIYVASFSCQGKHEFPFLEQKVKNSSTQPRFSKSANVSFAALLLLVGNLKEREGQHHGRTIGEMGTSNNPTGVY